ncbi:MAG: three-Cys-motif partner protein TcmP [Phycisphaerae bacterium]
MADPKDTVYKADPHTRAKHAILKEYLKRWLPILSRQARTLGSDWRLLYVDGFAGAGEYSGAVPGSPLVAIEAAAQHCHEFHVPIVFMFIEKRKDRVEHLRNLVADKKLAILGRPQLIVDPVEGDCETEVLKLVGEHKRLGRKLGPAFFFLDQFGYSSFSMALVRTILAEDVCEVFSYLNWNLLHPFMTDQTKWAGITKAFGGDEWKTVLGLAGRKKEERFRDVYTQALRDRGGARYTFPFAMRDHSDRIIYWLFFCTNNIRGREEMKKAMWTVDRSGGFEFSDKHSAQFGKLFSVDDDWLADHLFEEHEGKVLTVEEVREYVLTKTPCHSFLKALGLLERSDRLELVDPPEGRRRGSFTNDQLGVRFRRKPGRQGSLFPSTAP